MKLSRSILSAVMLAFLAGCATTTVTPPAAPSKAEAAALAVLATSQDVHEKARACQEISATTAGPASVAPLAALLDDEQLSDYARSGLENIPDPSAGKALRDALGRLQGRRLAGVVNSLGVRREKAAVADLRTLALDNQRGVAAEAVASLGLIATPDAVKVLQQILASGPANLKVDAAHASFIAADRLAKEGNASTARALLDAVAQAKPSEHLEKVAQAQANALTRR